MTTHDQETTTKPTTSAATGEGDETRSGDPLSPFYFVGDALALDLVNTEIVVRGKRIDLLAVPGAYAAWWRAAIERYPNLAETVVSAQANPELTPAAVTLRGTIRAVFGAIADGTPVPADALAVVNRALAATHDAVALGPAGEPRPLLVPRGPDADGPVAAIARSAFALLTGADHARLHRCANSRCILLFYDTTKSATRRWCSTACMNRARSSQRYHAQREGERVRGAATRSRATR